VGDITLGRAGQYPPGGSKQLLGRVARDLRAPVSLGNLETALVDPSVAARLPAKCNAKSPDCFLFGAPTAYARGLRDVGFTILDLANNHTNDYSEVGQAWTVLALARAGLRSTGRPEQITVLNVQGLRVAVLGFAPYSWASDLRDLKKGPCARERGRAPRGPRGGHDAHRRRRV
jgi:poly-gamma-glutamate capsule biosynthesis protein CapA/YwtB (metallophosphatase superfamily)